ncbi:MAG: hypothetical protein K5774_00760 [Clostridia bacterium]|nr:hypothetical protein [Clostridia bacterium]
MGMLKAPAAKRTTAAVIGLALLVAMLFSAFYIAEEADHDCTGEDCPVCACIQICENTLHRLGDGSTFLLRILAAVFFVVLVAAVIPAAVSRGTLITRKVRMND